MTEAVSIKKIRPVESSELVDKSPKPKEGKQKTPLIDLVQEYLDETYEFYFNVVQSKYYYRRLEDEQEEWEELNESDLEVELFRARFNGFAQVLKALMRSSYVTKINEVDRFFTGLQKPEKQPDQIELLASFLTFSYDAVENKKEQKLFAIALQKHLTRLIACALEDDYINRFIFVIHGAQYGGKSRFIEWLCPDELKARYYMAVDIFNPNNDFKIALGENLFVNFEELAGFDKTTTNQVKAISSIRYIKVREPFQPKAKQKSRISSMFGSTNDEEFLSDHTGSSRFIIFSVQEFDWQQYTINVNKELMWRQLYHNYLANSTRDFDLSRDEVRQLEERNNTFKQGYDELSLVSKHFEPWNERTHSELTRVFMTSTDIRLELETETNGRAKLNSVAIGRALSELGFIAKSIRDEGSFVPTKKYLVKRKN